MYLHEITDEMLIPRHGMNELESKIQLHLDMWDKQIETVSEELTNRQITQHSNLSDVSARVNEINSMLSTTFQRLKVTETKPINVMTENESVDQILQQCRMTNFVSVFPLVKKHSEAFKGIYI